MAKKEKKGQRSPADVLIDYTSDVVALKAELDFIPFLPGPDFLERVVEGVVDTVRNFLPDTQKLIRAHQVEKDGIKDTKFDEKGPDSFTRLHHTLLDYKIRAHLAESVDEIGLSFRSVFNMMFDKKTFDPNMKVDPGYLVLRTMYSYATHPDRAIPNPALDALILDPLIAEEAKTDALAKHGKETLTKVVNAWTLLLQDHPNAARIKRVTYDFVEKLARHPEMAPRYLEGSFSKRILPVMQEHIPEVKAALLLRQATRAAAAAQRARPSVPAQQ